VRHPSALPLEIHNVVHCDRSIPFNLAPEPFDNMGGKQAILVVNRKDRIYKSLSQLSHGFFLIGIDFVVQWNLPKAFVVFRVGVPPRGSPSSNRRQDWLKRISKNLRGCC